MGIGCSEVKNEESNRGCQARDDFKLSRRPIQIN